MLLGDTEKWAARFASLDDRILDRIAAVWPTLLDLLPGQPDEDTITINLVSLLGKDPVVRRLCHWIEFQFEPTGTHPTGAQYSKGQIDLAVILDWDRTRYLAYECKRLNVIYSGGRQSLAGPYVTDGMMRFITEQYAEGLEVGCMLGYVLDGDLGFSMERLANAIASHAALNILGGPVPMVPVHRINRFSTTHSRAGTKNIEVRHALLSHALDPFG
ncbi:hypothetical protein K9B35_08085 [Sphingomonas sp. R647]|jgi:hypothetical protein|uniref:hypothetical protein n=1 Tax=unclassified Sphingomonas TaxID=196159 RepID=UPI001CD2EF65|nr:MULTISPECIES: hypothetical protein [unclassified Sphingomonas]MCA1197922.1 hypothetical protein [Sphingomonas sp. R647]MCR5871307.1 hypothetical protein [Sphingomonas sp. J344]UUY00389.1 hypothetical protein LRS08_04600 [Sphingomonas sp. J315]